MEPPLTVRTVAVADPGDLIALLEPLHPLAFLRNGDGVIGCGERLSLYSTGLDRHAEIARWWHALVATALVIDDVNLPGTGLVSFGSFAFSETSAESSVLSVPAVIVGRRQGRFWVTTINGGQPAVPEPLGSDIPVGLSALRPGAMSRERYRDAVLLATQAIAVGRVHKVVIARDLEGRIPAEVDRRHVIARLARRYPDTFTFAVDGLIGSSPETLVRVVDGVVSARVLAGTTGRHSASAADEIAAHALIGDAKSRAEHEFAVRSVLSALSAHTSTIEHDPVPFALQLPNLWHLASDVRGTLLPGCTVLDLVAGLHPTAAVAGTPTADALNLIAELEPFDRARYAGPVGWLDAHGNGEWAIALRCAQIEGDGRIRAWAGAGLVADSNPDAELAETELKFRPVLEALSAAEEPRQ